MKGSNTCIVGIPGGEEIEKETENIFKALMVEDFPNMGREGDLKIQETKGILKRLN